ncbi:hypothetical protein L2E82_03485 [Cichorium intybus]|uniref:Uncharacterized protein n=1 Tax=Cichorium intybus TaxID=13427 RepID=A0ACB9H541_CICIN|nr:hypothetical protein L2E82_03485 [Cichorium intybus]
MNSKTSLLVCVAYISSHEISCAIYEACEERSRWNVREEEEAAEEVIKVGDVVKKMYIGVVSDPDILEKKKKQA